MDSYFHFVLSRMVIGCKSTPYTISKTYSDLYIVYRKVQLLAKIIHEETTGFMKSSKHYVICFSYWEYFFEKECK